ncbi:MAG: hypothetical protein J6V49_07565 [Bacteroidales bacterium]|nr:hypothetical protein [Bacteroidales bacterium]
MGVTIDSIQIEIESSSIGAAKGIDALAKSLEGLKKNGSFKTVSTNLNNLSDALDKLPNVHRAANALRTLANSIEKLKGVGTVAGLSNSLAKLPAALSGIGKIDLDKVAPQIEKVVAAVAPLSAVKAGGLNTMMNSLKKLGEVTKSLDTKTIDAFADKVALLTSKLGPLSEKMSTIKSGFSAINSGARSAASGVNELDSEIDASALNMSSFISIIQAVAEALQAVIQKFSEFISQAIEWDGIAARFGRSFGAEAEETYAWIQRLNEEMGLNVQQFMQYSSLYAQMLTGFGVASEDASKMALGYTELTYDIWASANDRYKSFEDAAEAVASAIAGEVEPIRRAGFTIVEATLAETAAYHGLDISLANATEAQKSYLRYLTLVDQAHSTGTIGVYAKELNTAEGMMRTFNQQLKSLAQAFGSLFLPILVKVMPYLQAFVELLAEGVRWIAGLFGVEIQDIGDTWKDYEAGAGAVDKVADSANGATGALDDATKAAKELKNATLGIDELNVISPQSATGGAGGSGGAGGAGGGAGGGFSGLDIDSLWDESIFDNIQSDVDAIKEKMRGWMPIIAGVATALGGLRLAKLIKDLDLIEKSKLFTGGLKFSFGKLKNFNGWITAFTQLAREGGILAALSVAFPNAAKALSTFTGNLSAFFALAKEFGVVQALSAAFPKLSTAISGVLGVLGGISAPVWAAIAAALVALASTIYFVVENWDELKQAVRNFFDENISPKLDEIKKHFDNIKTALAPLTDALQPVIDGFKNFFKNIDWEGFKTVFGEIAEGIGAFVLAMSTFMVSGMIPAIVGMFENLVQILSGVVQTIAGVIEFFVALFTGGDVEAACDKMIAGIADIFGGLWGLVTDPIVDFFNGVVSWFTELWDVLVGHSIVPDTIDAIVDWFLGLPGKVLDSIGKFVTDIVGKFAGLGKSLSEKFSAAWEDVKTWWSQKPSLSSFVPSIGSIKDKLSSAWTAAKDWWDKSKTTLATYTPSIGKIWENLKSAWETTKTWWSKNRGSLSTYTPSIGKIWEKLKSSWESAKTWWSKNRSNLSYTPSIGSISSKLSSAWTSAKNWWNKSRSSLSYTPSIGSIKDKVVSAWNSAKKWWSSNAKLSTKLNISVPKLTVNWGEVSALGKTFKYPKSFSVKFAAKGGIFDQGSLIWAGERGPEIMAEASGGRTGVMNVQQMQDAVYEGVYAAVSAAMRGMNGGGSQEVRVYLDGREISSSVRKHQHESGATIMGNEVYAY